MNLRVPAKRWLLLGSLSFAAFLSSENPVAASQKPAPSATEAESQPIDFSRDIQPLLAKNCFQCHGPDAAERQAGLRLDQRASATSMLSSGETAIVPGRPKQSELIRRVTTEDDLTRMPPPETGNRLSAEQVALLKRWIAQDAPFADHWAFVKPKHWPLPDITPPSSPPSQGGDSWGGWPRNGIDRFILHRLQQEGLKPSPEADRWTLIRRLSLDLRGLPPTPDEIHEFLNDESPNAYEKLVDGFLNDPAYGERWARVWLDLARYADSAGYGSDPLRHEMWPYRDWVIRALNSNIPYDRFTIEQLAGDVLPNPTLGQKVATAFHRNTMTNTEGGTDDEEFRVAAVKDRVDTTLLVWMGLTMGCAKCHNHKYDPIIQTEYYEFFAFFNQTADADRPDEQPRILVADDDERDKLKHVNAQIGQLKERLKQLETKEESDANKGVRKELQAKIAQLEKSKPEIPRLPVMQQLPDDKQRQTHVLQKGNFLQKGEPVKPGVLNAFHAMPEGAPQNRLGMARWLVHEDNPLTARVAVNRFWARLFGIGLVETEEDFGTQGEPPSHPKLLDWLAVEFMQRDWDMKSMLRLIVSSATYRQSSRVTPELLEGDPRNRLLSRGPRFRLSAEMIRDQALALSGLLSRQIGGPSVFPPQPKGLWQAAFNGQDRTWPISEGRDRHRRGLYTFWRRTVPYPSLDAFDAPSREVCAVRRVRTNTPLQSFVTMNDPAYVEAAQGLARRIVREGGSTVPDRARFGLQLCLGRPPSSAQMDQITALYRDALDHYQSHPQAAEQMATLPLGPVPDGIKTDELAAWTVVGNVLLNLDAVLTKQ